MQLTKGQLNKRLDKALVPVTWWFEQAGSPMVLRLKRGVRFHWKSIVYLISKFAPFTMSSKTFFGRKIHFRMPEHYYFFFFGFFVNNTSEAGLAKFLIQNTKEGDTILDIGSNCGLYTLLGSELVGESGSVHAFEPTEQIFKLLQKSTKDLGNAKVNNIALLDFSGESQFYTDEKYSVANSIEKTSETQTEHKVITQTLDEYCSQNDIAPSFMKIDAEGSELKILQGGTVTLQKYSPTIAMELLKDVEEVGQSAADLLIDMGYEAYRIENDGSLAGLSKEDIQNEEIFDGEGFVNLLLKKGAE